MVPLFTFELFTLIFNTERVWSAREGIQRKQQRLSGLSPELIWSSSWTSEGAGDSIWNLKKQPKGNAERLEASRSQTEVETLSFTRHDDFNSWFNL